MVEPLNWMYICSFFNLSQKRNWVVEAKDRFGNVYTKRSSNIFNWWLIDSVSSWLFSNFTGMLGRMVKVWYMRKKKSISRGSLVRSLFTNSLPVLWPISSRQPISWSILFGWDIGCNAVRCKVLVFPILFCTQPRSWIDLARDCDRVQKRCEWQKMIDSSLTNCFYRLFDFKFF